MQQNTAVGRASDDAFYAFDMHMGPVEDGMTGEGVLLGDWYPERTHGRP